MRKVFVACLMMITILVSVFAQKKQETLAKIGNYPVTLSEFNRIYQRNNSNIQDPHEKRSAAEYLQMYINFKLKVLEAQAIKLDTAHSFKTELAGYRTELAAPYLTDISYNEKQVEETYQRMKLEINGSHILIAFPQNPAPADTLATFQQISDIWKKIDDGLDFNDAAMKFSNDPSAASNQGNLGWFTAFQMVYPFENAAYSTPVGKVSKPFQTRFGYHILKVNATREALGELKVAHIMKAYPQGVSPELKAEVQHEMENIYNMVKNGSDFGELAKQFSSDERSAANGGELPWFSRSRMIPEFGDPAFSLANNGDFTRPVDSGFGFHIIKKLDYKPIPPFEDIKRELIERISRDPDRNTQSREIFLQKLKKEYNFTRNQENIKAAEKQISSWLTEDKFAIPMNFRNDKVLFSLNNKMFTTDSWIDFLRTQPMVVTLSQSDLLHERYVQWEESSIIDYENAKLEEKYPDFKSLMQEYHDGLLLFSISEKEIWQKASTDSIGLMNFYETNKQKYLWGERYKGVIFKCLNSQVLEIVEKHLAAEVPVDELFSASRLDSNLVSITKGAWSKGENPIVDYLVWNGPKPAHWSDNSGMLEGKLVASEPKSLDESRGFHISDYQQFLEDKWLNDLRKKYPVKLNKKLLKTLNG